MTRDSLDPILDAFLKEILREDDPPDVSDAVLEALKVPAPPISNADGIYGDAAAFEGIDGLTADDPADVVVASARSAANDHPLSQPEREFDSRRPWLMPAIAMACAAACLLLATTLIVVLTNQPNGNGMMVAQGDEHNEAGDNSGRALAANEEADRSLTDGSSNRSTTDDQVDGSAFDQAPPFGQRTIASADRVAPPSTIRVPRQADEEVVQFVNTVIQREIDRTQIRPLGLISDDAWLARTFESLLGRAPTETEVVSFRSVDGGLERERIVDQLLNDSPWSEEVARHWAQRLASSWLSIPRNADDRYRAQIVQFLTQSLMRGDGLDRIAVDVLTATGSDQPNASDFNPAAAYLIAHFDPAAERITEQVAEQFMGSRISCVKCHDHQLAKEWDQQEYWRLNAFFRQIAVQRDGAGQAKVVDIDFRGDLDQVEDAVIFLEDEQGLVQAIYPTFAGEQITTSGRVSDVNRRSEFASRLSNSATFHAALVNRIWASVFGVGMTRPANDLASYNPVSHPELLARLSEQFAAHEFRLQPLLKWIVLSEPFAREEEKEWELVIDSPRTGNRPLFSRFYRQPGFELPASQTIEQVAVHREELDAFRGGNGLSANFGSQNLNANDGNTTEGNANDASAVDQQLVDLFHARGRENPWGTSAGYAKLLDKLMASRITNREKIEHMFMIALSRTPTRREMEHALEMLRYYPDQSEAGFRDVWWTLTISEEFDR